MRKKLLLSWMYGSIAIFSLAILLHYVVIPFGINLGKEREARDFAVIVLIVGVVAFFGNIGFWSFKAVNEPPPESTNPPPKCTSPSVGGKGLGWIFSGLLIVVLIQIAGGIFVLLLMYGIAVLIFRHAFGVELPNPF